MSTTFSFYAEPIDVLEDGRIEAGLGDTHGEERLVLFIHDEAIELDAEDVGELIQTLQDFHHAMTARP